MRVSCVTTTRVIGRLLMAVCLGALASLVMVGPAAGQLEPVAIDDVRLDQTDDSSQLQLQADGALIWTQYRDADSNLVVELPNTVLGSSIEDLIRDSGLVSSVELVTESNGDRPLTKIVVRTRDDAESELMVDDRTLQLTLTRSGAVVTAASPLPDVADETAPVAVADTAPAPIETEPIQPEPIQPEPQPVMAEVSEPVMEEPSYEAEPVSTEVASAPMAPVALGTADEPVYAPPPLGVTATRLEGVMLEDTTDGKIVRVLGDGDFDYSTFVLENPRRFVVDLRGVVNTSPQSTVPVNDMRVERVRMAQFSPQPSPVARVVFDLVGDSIPLLERGSDGLAVRFADPGAVSAAPVAMASQSSEPSSAFVEEQSQETATVEPWSESTIETEPFETASAETDEWAEDAPLIIEQPSEAPLPRTAESTRSDVSLFEAQDVEISTPSAQVESQPENGFGVRTIGAEKEYFGEPISMSLKDADITEVLRSIARLSNLNIVIQPGVSGPVTVELDRVPWDQALEQVLKLNRLGMELEGNILRIAPASVLQAEARERQQLEMARALSVPLRTVIKRISYARADEVARILTTGQQNTGPNIGGVQLSAGGIMSQRGSVSIDPRTNTLIIQELPDYLDTVIQIIENIDIPEKQVMIEARIVETTRNFSRTLGVAWGFDAVSDRQFGNTTGLQFPNNGNVSGGVNLLTGGGQRPVGDQPGQRAEHLHARRTAPGGRKRRSGQCHLGTEGRDAEQPGC